MNANPALLGDTAQSAAQAVSGFGFSVSPETLTRIASEMKGKVKVYGADISTADIELMTAEGSPWVATGATDPNAIGAAVVRTLALNLAGEVKESAKVEFPPILVTAQMLRDKGVKNMEDLRAAQPQLNISSVSSAAWIPTVTF